VGQMLDTLRNLWLVEREFAVTVTNPERSRQSFYRITNPYLRFWFRFVLPAQCRLADDEGAERHLHETRGAELRDVDRELDVVAIDDDVNVIAIGSCKWTAGELPYSEKTKLEVLGAHLVPEGPAPQLCFFSRSGFADELTRAAEASDRIRLVGHDELFASVVQLVVQWVCDSYRASAAR
jgi:hypothetical protein